MGGQVFQARTGQGDRPGKVRFGPRNTTGQASRRLLVKVGQGLGPRIGKIGLGWVDLVVIAVVMAIQARWLRLDQVS